MNLKGTQSVFPATLLAIVFIGSVFLGLLVCIIGGHLFNASRHVVGTAWLLVSSTLFLVLLTAALTSSVRQLLLPGEVTVLKEWAAEFPEVDAALQALRSKTMEPRFWHFLAIQRIAKRALNKREYERARTTLQDALK